VSWEKYSYGGEDSGHWTISNGHVRFDVHVVIDGSGRKSLYPDGIIVSKEQADEYAEKILQLLITNDLKLEE
jgi:hypothetical protein